MRNNPSQNLVERRCYIVNASSEIVAEMKADEAPFDLDAIFRAQYERIARVIARVVRDPARAEELAVEVFLKLWRNRQAQGEEQKAGCTAPRYERDWMSFAGKHAGHAMKDFFNLCVRRRPLNNSTPQARNKSGSG